VKRRIIAFLVASALAVATAVPALAQSPKDAQGCENTRAGQLADYCENS
jgi:hypothetical protein